MMNHRNHLIQSRNHCEKVLMVGTHPHARGGIPAVVRGYMAGGLFECINCSYVHTHKDGSVMRKAWIALGAYARIALALVRARRLLLHIHQSSRASFWRKSIICMMAMLMRRPYVLHIHGSEYMKFFNDECGPLSKRYMHFIFKHAAVMIALSEQWKQNIWRICPQARVEIIPNAVELPDLKLKRLPEKAAHHIVSLGKIGKRKGSFDLVEAFARLDQIFPDACLICIGNGALNEVGQLAQHKGVGDRVSLPGWLDPQQAQRALAQATIFVLPSYSEGLPMALLEAMSWGIPVITTPVDGIPFVVSNEKNGLMVPPGDIEALSAAMKRLLTHSSERTRFGMAARKSIESRFSLESQICRLLDLYANFGISITNRQ